MSVITRMQKQICVYWAPATATEDFDDYGQPVVKAGVELSCRWEDINEEFIGADGTRQLSSAKVYVESDVQVGGILMLGELTDITDAVNIKENSGAWEVKKFDKLPNFKATEFLRTAFL